MSSDITQVNYQSLADIATQFERQATVTEQQLQKEKQAVETLSRTHWEGEGSTAFFNEVNHDVFPAMARLAHALHEGNTSLKKIAEIFSASEVEAAALFQGTADGGGGGGGTWGDDDSSWNWGGWAKNLGDKMISPIKEILKSGLGELLSNNPVLSDALDAAGFGIGVLLDEDASTDLPRAIAGELGKLLLKKGLIYLIPYAGPVFLASDFAQVAGVLIAGAVASTGNTQLAEDIKWGFSTINLSGYLEELFEGIYDFLKMDSPTSMMTMTV